MGAEHRPQQDRADYQRQRYENEKGPAIPNITLLAADDSENYSANRADQNLSEDGGADATLLQMVVATDTAHNPKEWLRRKEHTDAVAQNHQRRRDPEEPREHK